MKGLTVLGSTGSIGTNTLEVVRTHPKRFKIESLSVHSNIEELAKQIEEFQPKKVVIAREDKYHEFKEKYSFPDVRVLSGEDALLELVIDPDVDLVINALVGFSGLKPTLEAIDHSKDIAIANKETIVVGGELVLSRAREKRIQLIPIDSEHSALLFLLRYNKRSEVKKLILTASGGPFRTMPKADLQNVTLEQALNHPTWKMGQKITIDSSTLMNKGFEVIEAHHLFDFHFDDIEVIVHKESIIHSMIETIDGEVYAQLGPTDMKFPIQNAMTYPEVVENSYHKMKLWEIGTLSFEQPDYDKFPLLQTAFDVGRVGGTLPAVLNGSNEIVVYAFLEKRIQYRDIHPIIKECLDAHQNVLKPEIKDIFEADKWARDYSENIIRSLEK